jgi:hypothetical protein
MAAKQKKPPSPLLAAAQAFEDELTSYAHLSDAFVRAPLDSARHLERASELLAEVAASEQRLGECGRRLAEAVGGARDDQEKKAMVTLERVPLLKQRTAELAGLLKQLQELGVEAVGLNETAGALAGHGPAAGPKGDQAAEPRHRARELSTAIAGLSRRAQEVAVAARQSDFEDIARQAHALHQQLLAAHRKLHLAAGGPIERDPLGDSAG